MPYTNIRMTYMGSMSFDGSGFFCTDMSNTVDVTPLFYDHVMGLNDVGTGSETKGAVGGTGADHIQKKIYRMSPKLPKCSFSGPVSDGEGGAGSIKDILDAAISGKDDIVCLLNYTSLNRDGCKVYEAVVSSVTFTATAGDVCSFSCEVVGRQFTPIASGGVAMPCDKLLTWDRVVVTASGSDMSTAEGCSSFSLTISNPVIPIYTAGSNADEDLYPKTLRIGTQEVTGSIALNRFAGVLAGPGIVNLDMLGVGSYDMNVVFGAGSSSGNTGRLVSTVPFTGANDGPVFS